jgi:hypothetical protein
MRRMRSSSVGPTGPNKNIKASFEELSSNTWTIFSNSKQKVLES